MKTCLPASTAASKCIGRKPGGVARMHQVDAAVEHLLVGVEAGEACRGRRRHVDPRRRCRLVRRPLQTGVQLSAKASAMAISLTLPFVEQVPELGRPVPRPPQPIRAILMSSSPAAWAAPGDAQTAGQAPPARAAAEDVFRKSRRDASVIGSTPWVGCQSW